MDRKSWTFGDCRRRGFLPDSRLKPPGASTQKKGRERLLSGAPGRCSIGRTLLDPPFDLFPDNGQFVGRLDADADDPLSDADHGHRDLVPNEDLFADFSRQNEHHAVLIRRRTLRALRGDPFSRAKRAQTRYPFKLPGKIAPLAWGHKWVDSGNGGFFSRSRESGAIGKSG